MVESSTRIENSRDVLEAMVHQEEKYYICRNYISSSKMDCKCEGLYSVSHESSLQAVREIASLVTDVHTDNRGKTDGDGSCTSPGSTIYDLYEILEEDGSTVIALDLYQELDKKRRHEELQQNQFMRRRSYEETQNFIGWRRAMLGWAREVCKTFGIGITVLEAAFNILDRFIAIGISPGGAFGGHPVAREDFQLFGIVSLYVACKAFDRKQKIQLHDWIEMAQGFYTKSHITATECVILETLEWHVNPRTVIDYCHIYLALFLEGGTDLMYSSHSVPEALCNVEREQITMVSKCKYMVGIVLEDLVFMDKPKSVVALAVVLLVTDESYHYVRNPLILHAFLQRIQGVVNIHKCEFDAIMQRLEFYC
jgi:hypothetical protein